MTTDQKIIFIGSQNDIFSLFLRKHGLNVLPSYKYQSRLAYRIRYLINLLHINTSLLSELHDDVKTAEADIVVLMGSLLYEPFIKQLRKLYPFTIIKYCYPNIVKDNASLRPDILRKYNIELYSWDPEDCRKFNLCKLKSCYENGIFELDKDFKYDLCFIGADKGRYRMIKEINEYAESKKLRTYIHVTPTYNFLRFLHSYYKKTISYTEYLSVVSKSKCIIDFVREGQSGTTMRTMEAIFSGQKLISNNVFLKQMDFYHPNNIFILTDNNINEIEDFLNKEVVPIQREILATYTFDYWYKALIGNED